ncbi:hypothetical protein KP79_PYT24228 [Mizuhopecten yessoensis]|uniref:Ubiquitin-like domain-containing protein n=1 Tax=Mizuhopecten yessoensis TaxID=6573 RepID=A0A210Q108_MIZYE|nr:hypothetical protein KP79_PYT24228 [Mizuhopecten yessoensis]
MNQDYGEEVSSETASTLDHSVKNTEVNVLQLKTNVLHAMHSCNGEGYAFVELYCESSIDMVLTLDKQIEVNKAPLQLERSKSSIRKRRQQVTKKQVEHVQTPDSLNSSSFVGYHTYTEYKHDRNKKERGHKPAVISIRKLKKKKPWKKVTMQTPITPPRPRLVKKVPTGFEHSRKRNYHHIIAKCPSITTCVEHRNRKQNSVLNSIPVDSIQNVEEDIIPACGKDASKISTPHTDCGSSSLKTSGYFTFQKRLPLKRVANNPGSQFVQAHVYHNSKYLFDIDVDNNMVFESIQTAICHKHKITSDSFLLFFNGRLLDKTSQTMICNDENIHMTVKGVGGMNEDDRQSSRRRRRLRGAQERIRGATWNRVEDRYSSSGPFEHQHVTRKPVNSSGRRTYFDRWSAENRSASSNRGYLATRSKPITRQTEKTTKPVEDISPSLREISSSLDHLHLTPTPSSRSRRSTITDVDDWLSRGNRTASDYYSSRHFAISPEPVDQQTGNEKAGIASYTKQTANVQEQSQLRRCGSPEQKEGYPL